MTLLDVLLALSLGALLFSGGFQLLTALTLFNRTQETQWHQIREGLQIAYSLRNLLRSAPQSAIQISQNPPQIQITHTHLSHTCVYFSPPALYWVHPNGYQSLWVSHVSEFKITGPVSHLTLSLTLEHPTYSADYWLSS